MLQHGFDSIKTLWFSSFTGNLEGFPKRLGPEAKVLQEMEDKK